MDADVGKMGWVGSRFVRNIFLVYEQNMEDFAEDGFLNYFKKLHKSDMNNYFYPNMVGWKTILSFWISAYFQGILLLVSGWLNHLINFFPPTITL